MNIKVNVSGVDAALERVTSYLSSVQRRSDRICQRLTFVGQDKADEGFATADYAGTNDYTTATEQTSNGYDVVAYGKDVLFLEFGAGVLSPDHPMAAELGMLHGQYHPNSKGATGNAWGYYGEPGTVGQKVRDSENGPVSITYGQPASKAMYNASQTMREQFNDIVKEEWRE